MPRGRGGTSRVAGRGQSCITEDVRAAATEKCFTPHAQVLGASLAHFGRGSTQQHAGLGSSGKLLTLLLFLPEFLHKEVGAEQAVDAPRVHCAGNSPASAVLSLDCSVLAGDRSECHKYK